MRFPRPSLALPPSLPRDHWRCRMVNACGRETITYYGTGHRPIEGSGRNQRCSAPRNSLMTACYAMIRTDVAAEMWEWERAELEKYGQRRRRPMECGEKGRMRVAIVDLARRRAFPLFWQHVGEQHAYVNTMICSSCPSYFNDISFYHKLHIVP